MFQYFYEGKLDVNRMNYGVITLLPKIKDARKIHQYRHIGKYPASSIPS
jgi:hypothetical protein